MFASLLPHHDDDGLAAVRLNAATAGALALVTFLILRLGLVVYRFFFHPLRKFPGPKLWAASDLPYTYSMHLAGTGIRQVTEFHKRYGPVIRVGPNRLALDGSVGWPQIFARRPGAEPEHEKAPKYFSPGVEYAIIGSARETHRRQRKQLAHAFSDASIHDQEKTISEYVQLLVQRIGEHAQSEKTLNIVQWLNFATFDIIGQLTYGESFGSLASSDYHPWVLGIFQGIQADSFLRACRVYPVMGTILTNLFPSKGIKGVENRKLAMAKGKARMELGLQPKKQKDFTTYMMQPNRDGKPGLSQTEIMANSPILVVAGSETTASALSAFFFYINQTTQAKAILLDEIRTKFQDESDITLTSTNQLEYLHAVIEETLRMYPPAPNTPSRVSPGGEIDGKFVPKGTEVSVTIWSTFRNPEHFFDPNSFRPERWLKDTHPLYDAKFANDNHAVFKPFSYGPRDCIGKNLAYSEMRMIISHLVFKFNFELLPGQDDWHSKQLVQFIWDKGPLYVKFRFRDVKH